VSPDCLACRAAGCNRRVLHFRRIAGTDHFQIVNEEEPKVPRGIPNTKPIDINPETGRRQLFSIAVKYGLTVSDLQNVADQLAAMDILIGQWHDTEVTIMTDMLTRRNGESLAVIAESASGAAWAKVADQFAQQFPGYQATLVKGVVRVQES
jgi:hypothetical protein